ncbi:class I SAM-dependent methyltransferase [Actinokineospora enzanensis]|uniref:class I SAM-dependent methyltransferase n=1 Tax=Actinokineospora enzanensis TaxID=155975 RepID=UPI000377DDCD|nr:SAM-dependent methyltransferase [Actinokineospora enzanensis]
MPTTSTAETTTLLRAAGALLPDQSLRGPDVLAARLLPWRPLGRALIKVPGLRSRVARAVLRNWPSALWYEVARTRYMDDVVRAEVAAGARQVVILGAGFDTRAYRLRSLFADAAVYEVDQAEVSELKQARAGKLGTADVRYVVTDFNEEDLAAAMARGGFDPGVRSVVVWSGVTPYLEEHGVVRTLRWFASQASGSSIVFDYAWREIVEGTEELSDASTVMRNVAARGEPWRWGIRKGCAAEFLGSFGLVVAEHLDMTEAQERYLRRTDGGVQGPVWTFGGFAHARVG